ncbi:MAG: ABC transporter permease [Terriglobales bacterium]|jgi:putative ABC transport system permease protein
MNLLETLRETFATLRAHKMRSFLTMFGIVWGIASVILLVGLGRGFSKDEKERLKTIGTDIAIVWGGRTSAQAGGLAAGREVRLNVSDVELIKKECYLVKNASPELRRSVPQVSAYNQANRPVRGVWPEYQNFRSLKVSEGRLMTQEDQDTAARVVLLGTEAREQLFPGKPAIGENLQMGGIPFRVIGVLQKKKQNGSYGSGPDNTQLFVPYSTMARDLPPSVTDRPYMTPGWINNLVIQVDNADDHEAAIKQIYRALGRVHHFDEKDEDALMIWDTMHSAKLTQRIFSVMTMFFGAVALMTLFLGGIGVMNIMLVSVTERTREIGVRKALGATKREIAMQFFTEAIIISFVSGVLGLAVGLGFSFVLNIMPKPDFVPSPVISAMPVVVAVVTLSVITIAAGLYPATRAAELTPVDCLRYE